jgi:hypothetical protein
MNLRRISLWSLCLLCVLVVNSEAAPPTLAPLFPAGGQRGATVELNTKTKLWSNSKSLSFDQSKVKIVADAAPGTYWLRSFNDDGASALRPFIVGTLPELVEKEPNDEPKTAHVLAASAVVNGKLAKAGDVDCFSIAAKQGQTLVASLEANRTLKSPMDAVIQIVSPDGFVLDENHDFHGLDPQVMYPVPKDGTYVVRVFAFPSAPDTTIRFSGAETYIYRLTITTGGFLDHTVPLAAAPSVKSVEARGWNIPNDANSLPIQDGLAFHPKLANAFQVKSDAKASTHLIAKLGGEVRVPFVGKKGQALAIGAESRSFGLAVDPVIRVLDKDGKSIARAEPPKLHSDTAMSFTPPTDGDYTVAISDLYSGGGSRFAFLLRVAAPEPDFDLVLAADRFVVPPGKPLDVPIKITRKHGFAKPIEIAAEGLPAGVKFEMKPAAKPDPNLVTITLSAEKATPGGAFRLIGKVKEEPAFTRLARAPLTEFEETTADLWVCSTDDGAAPVPKKKK